MISTQMIIEEVTGYYQLEPEDVLAHRRRQDPFPRRLSWRLARDLTPLSLTQIGRHIGGFDHTTVLYGLRRIDEQLVVHAPTAHDHRRIQASLIERESKDPAKPDHRLSPLDLAARLLDGDGRASLHDIRTLCQEVQRLSGRVSALLEANPPGLRAVAGERPDAIAAAAREVAASANAVAIDTHTPRERGSRRRHATAIAALQTLFERT